MNPTQAPAIETEGLTKFFGENRGVEDLSLRVERGEVFGFLGPNGAGKTTTIRLLLDLAHPSRGSARVLGLDSHAGSVNVHRSTGYLPGDLQLFDRLTGAEHIRWFSRARQAGGSATDPALASKLVARFGAITDRPVRELSKGNRQKVGLVLALAHRPELAILDEPTSGLDPLVQDEFDHLVREIAAEGRTVFLSSHDLDEVQRVADRVAIIRAGRLVVVDSVEALRRGAPSSIQLRLARPADIGPLSSLPGVTHVVADGAALSLQVTGELAPVLHAIADLDPMDVTARRANLEELFLRYYQTDPAEGHADAS
ncbi:MAG: ABC transporter ATP-binding protein [Actinomycetota bacterium]